MARRNIDETRQLVRDVQANMNRGLGRRVPRLHHTTNAKTDRFNPGWIRGRLGLKRDARKYGSPS